MKLNIIRSFPVVLRTHYFIGLFLFHVLYSQDVIISFGDIDYKQNTIDINIVNTTYVDGIQFGLQGISLGDWVWENGGLVYINEMNAGSSIDGDIVLIFAGLIGQYIPPSNGLLATFEIISIDSSFACITDPIAVFLGDFLVVESPDCISLDYCELTGDLNDDSLLDVLDVVIGVSCILNYENCICGDFDGNGTFDIIDIVILLDHII